MPLLQYKCQGCNIIFDELVSNYKSEVVCPNCKKPAQRVWSGTVYSSTGKPPKKCTGNCSGCSGCK